MKKNALLLAMMLGMLPTLGGCLLGAAYVAGEEINENDGDFDPLDEVIDG